MFAAGDLSKDHPVWLLPAAVSLASLAGFMIKQPYMVHAVFPHLGKVSVTSTAASLRLGFKGFRSYISRLKVCFQESWHMARSVLHLCIESSLERLKFAFEGCFSSLTIRWHQNMLRNCFLG
jgi:hypothetical protein